MDIFADVCALTHYVSRTCHTHPPLFQSCRHPTQQWSRVSFAPICPRLSAGHSNSTRLVIVVHGFVLSPYVDQMRGKRTLHEFRFIVHRDRSLGFMIFFLRSCIAFLSWHLCLSRISCLALIKRIVVVAGLDADWCCWTIKEWIETLNMLLIRVRNDVKRVQHKSRHVWETKKIHVFIRLKKFVNTITHNIARSRHSHYHSQTIIKLET